MISNFQINKYITQIQLKGYTVTVTAVYYFCGKDRRCYVVWVYLIFYNNLVTL